MCFIYYIWINLYKTFWNSNIYAGSILRVLIPENIRAFYMLLDRYINSTGFEALNTDDWSSFKAIYHSLLKMRKQVNPIQLHKIYNIFEFIRIYHSKLHDRTLSADCSFYVNDKDFRLKLEETQVIKLKTRHIIHFLKNGPLLSYYSDIMSAKGCIPSIIYDIVQQLRIFGITDMLQMIEDELKHGRPLARRILQFHPWLLHQNRTNFGSSAEWQKRESEQYLFASICAHHIYLN